MRKTTMISDQGLKSLPCYIQTALTPAELWLLLMQPLKLLLSLFSHFWHYIIVGLINFPLSLM